MEIILQVPVIVDEPLSGSWRVNSTHVENSSFAKWACVAAFAFLMIGIAVEWLVNWTHWLPRFRGTSQEPFAEPQLLNLSIPRSLRGGEGFEYSNWRLERMMADDAIAAANDATESSNTASTVCVFVRGILPICDRQKGYAQARLLKRCAGTLVVIGPPAYRLSRRTHVAPCRQ